MESNEENLKIYNLKIMETCTVEDDEATDFKVTRVPGGWIFRNHSLPPLASNDVFVPYSENDEPEA